MSAPDKPQPVLGRRRAGVLLHITSLPGEGGPGTLGREAYRFVDFLAEAGFTVWQTLPLGPVDEHLSPYKSISTHAGHAGLIDLPLLLQEPWLAGYTPTDEQRAGGWASCIDALFQFFSVTDSPAREELARQYQNFQDEQAFWLEDYAFFVALGRFHGGLPWHRWEDAFRQRDPAALRLFSLEHHTLLQTIIFEQFIFFYQWQKLHRYARRKGVFIFGDLPIFVAHDSADVWANQRLFNLNSSGEAVTLAGVPPDYFSDSGQLWGNPHYRWETMQEDQFRWWRERLATSQRYFDLVRLDHFRGLEAYWEVPAADRDARGGWWTRAPGGELLEAVFREFPDLELVAENLGVITPGVEALRRRFALAGMSVLQFGFDGNPDNPHLLHNHEPLQVTYTGTHDNAPLAEWYESLTPAGREVLRRYFFFAAGDATWLLNQAAFSSVARLAIIPLQDLLGLGSEGRMNIPGTTGDNWQWQLRWSQMPDGLAGRVRELLRCYGREPPPDGEDCDPQVADGA